MKTALDDTICAVSTPQGTGGIAVIRVSGADAFSSCDRILKQRKQNSSYAGFTLHRATVMDSDEIVDDVLVSVFKAPRSFTGEDVVEISCHGGRIPTSKILQLLLAGECRAAAPGEFTQRAFLNGRMDLSQAEAVCDLINAKTDEAYRLAVSQQGGALCRAADHIRTLLLGILARIEASIDFPEDVGDLDFFLCEQELRVVEMRLDELLRTADRGILMREGAQVVIAGQPNAGKSSLMNALLRTDRAIVTDVPGTTRDTIEETLNVRGVAVRLWDTAGLRETVDPVEAFGISRTRSAIESADLVLLVVDCSVGLTPNDRQLLKLIGGRPCIIVWNKCDIGEGEGLLVSAKDMVGIQELEDAIATALLGDSLSEPVSGAVLTHVRQKSAVMRASISVRNSLETIAKELPSDFLSIDVRAALTAIGEITGQSAAEDVINEIFSRFCIGK